MQTINNTDYQQELFRLIPPNITGNDVKEIKKLLVKYFAHRATTEMDKFWDENNFKSAKEMENYLND